MENTCTLHILVHCISNFEGISYKIIQDAANLPVPLFLVVLHRITICIRIYHFYNYLEPNPTFTGKRFLSRIFVL